MPTQITRKSGYNNARTWKDVIQNSSSNSCPVYYISVGNHIPYANEASPDGLFDTDAQERTLWDNMFAAKRVTGNDVEMVVPRKNWVANVKYRQYDDTILLSDLISTNTSQNLFPLYVITSARNVYKCLSNNASANSTVEPTGDYTTSNGNIATADGYIWKYMYNVKPSNKFLTEEWIPVPVTVEALDYGTDDTGVVDGELTTIVVTNSGSNYRQASNIRVNGFASGQTTLRLSNTTLTLGIFSIPVLSNLANMSISGTGIPSSTYIESISNTTGVITLSSATNAFGGNANNITISTRVFVDGTGTGVVANATLSNTSTDVDSANANVSKITVTTIGTNYSTANVFVFGSGSGSEARAIISPKFGHAFNPARELMANSAMMAIRLGEVDSTESGLISVDTSFRQLGLFRDPYKYGDNVKVNLSTSNTVISQTTDLSVVAGLSYTLNEKVYQGSSTNPSAYGFINAQTSNQVRLTRVKGTFSSGLTLIGETSGVARTVVTVSNPEFEPYTGDILYIENAVKTDRADGQAENLKFIVKF
jgi:hypothetical protein